MRNTGSLPLQISAIVITPSGSPFQRIGGDCADGIASRHPPAVRYRCESDSPTESGAVSGTVVILHNAAGGNAAWR